ncbi:MAG: hypothetical protein WDZ41_00230 [Candidatus Babeliales bacterium]
MKKLLFYLILTSAVFTNFGMENNNGNPAALIFLEQNNLQEEKVVQSLINHEEYKCLKGCKDKIDFLREHLKEKNYLYQDMLIRANKNLKFLDEFQLYQDLYPKEFDAINQKINDLYYLKKSQEEKVQDLIKALEKLFLTSNINLKVTPWQMNKIEEFITVANHEYQIFKEDQLNNELKKWRKSIYGKASDEKQYGNNEGNYSWFGKIKNFFTKKTIAKTVSVGLLAGLGYFAFSYWCR